MDQFAQIAANGIGGNAALLEPTAPIPHETVICRLEQADAQPIAVNHKWYEPLFQPLPL